MSDSPNESRGPGSDGAPQAEDAGPSQAAGTPEPAADTARADRTEPAGGAEGRSADGGPDGGGTVTRKRPNRLILPVVVVGLLALGAVAYYFYYQGANFVSSQDASVQGHVVYIYPPAAGTLEAWNVRLSEYVPAHSVLGTVRTPATLPAQGADAASAAIIGVPVTTSVPGVIVQNAGVVGEQVNPALGLPLAAEVDPHDLWIEVNIRETDIGRVHIGQLAGVTVDALPGRTFTGHVAAIEEATQSTFSLIPASATSGTFTKVTQRIPVKVVLTDTAGMSPGMSAEVRIHLH